MGHTGKDSEPPTDTGRREELTPVPTVVMPLAATKLKPTCSLSLKLKSIARRVPKDGSN